MEPVYNKVKIYFLLLILMISCDKKSEENPCITKIPCKTFNSIIDTSTIFAWEEVLSDGITSLVGKTIVIKSKIYWSTGSGWFEDPPEIKGAGSLILLFEYTDDSIVNSKWQYDERGNLNLTSDQIIKYIDCEEKQEKYALNCQGLSNNEKYYLIQGKIKYRDSLGLDDEDLTDPRLIHQFNNIVYWSQSFEFVSEKIRLYN